MPYKRLIKIYGERKEKLNALLDDNHIGLKEQRAQSIKGAVDEINLFINILNQYQEQVQTTLEQNRLVQQNEAKYKQGVLSFLF